MVVKFVSRFLGSRNDRLLKSSLKQVNQINALESQFELLSDAQLADKTKQFKELIAQGETLDALLPQAFALVREASKRTLNMRHFDVQLQGGMMLHQGKIAEMCTGEGKTLVATLPAYLNALTGKGVHIVTVNDYLAKRDAEWMTPVYQMLGLTVGVIVPNLPQEARREAYEADITYGTNNEFGFDYLRDNMAFDLTQRVQRLLNFAIIDEVDSILIDEARTPLIISGHAENDAGIYAKINDLIPKLKLAVVVHDEESVNEKQEEPDGHYTLDEKTKQVHLTEQGHQFIELLLMESGLLEQGASLYDVQNMSLLHYCNASMRAHFLYKRDVDYIVKDNQIVIVDEHTGRTMQGRRWSEGLHQAVEAKEGVTVQSENQTLASITFQNYFRLYEKISGMTGTADTEAFEFHQIYGLEVVVLPTNKPLIRQDLSDQVYLTAKSKYQAVLKAAKACYEKGQPVLIGTASIESSEYLSQLLKKAKIPHQVLNAKYHQQEAKIISQAGRYQSVTIATNMAGRGTDIVLGGNFEASVEESKSMSSEEKERYLKNWRQEHDKILKLGGLHVLGTERHESRRIDNQLRGRSGRQGDPGSSRFYLSLDDNLMRIFASDWVSQLMRKLGLKEDEVIEHKMISRSIENAQRKVEAYNFDIRKQLLRYDDVINDQRKVIYAERYRLLKSEMIHDAVLSMFDEVAHIITADAMPENSYPEQWLIEALQQNLKKDFGLDLPIKHWLKTAESVSADKIEADIKKALIQAYQDKIQPWGEIIYRIEKSLMLECLDTYWKEHLARIDHLRQGIHLRGYAQKDPIQEFKREAFELFSDMLYKMKYTVVSQLSIMHIEVKPSEEQEQSDLLTVDGTLQKEEVGDQEVLLDSKQNDYKKHSHVSKVGRNHLCPCGSKKKYKHCHGQSKL